MFTRILTLALLVCLLVGCGKTRSTSPDVAVKSKAAPKATPNPKDKADPSDKPNWLNDTRYQRPERDDPRPDPISASGKPIGGGLAPPPGGWTGGNPGAVPVTTPPTTTTPATGSGTITPSQPSPGGKTVTKADMEEVWTFIQYASGASGRMPTRDQVEMALFQAKPPAASAELVRSGYIVVTGATTRDSIWAYDAKALTSGGWVASQNGVENLTAAQLAQRLR